MLDYADGTGHADGANYLELVEFIIKFGSDVDFYLPDVALQVVRGVFCSVLCAVVFV